MLARREHESRTDPPGGGGPEAEEVTLIAPRSQCPRCRHQLRWFDNIPVVSYLFLRAKCANCGKAISPLYPAVELLACLFAIVAAIRFGGDPRLYGALVLSFALIPIAFIDARHFIIPDDIVLPMLWLGLLCNAFDLFAPLRDAVFGAVAGYGTLWSVYWLHRLATGKEGMGYGDFKLAAMLGAWLGVGLVPLVLVLAFAAGALVGTGLTIARRTGIAMAIPFGPFLAAAGWVSLYWGDALIGAYWTLVLRW
jgi:leader peptidase (prepilin peptidase)/N-methyltransferase